MGNKRPKLVLADTDRGFLRTLEEPIIRRFSTWADVQIIADPGYVNAYFSAPQDIAVLAMRGELYGDGSLLAEQNVGHLLVAAAEGLAADALPEGAELLPKGADAEQVLAHIDELLQQAALAMGTSKEALAADFVSGGKAEEDRDQNTAWGWQMRQGVGRLGQSLRGPLRQGVGSVLGRGRLGDARSAAGTGSLGGDLTKSAGRRTKIIAVYSPIGGCGKSLACIALARKLRMLDQKVLCIGCDPMQSIGVFYPSGDYADDALVEKLQAPDDATYWTILKNIATDEVSYVLPFRKSLVSMGVGMKEIDVMIDILAEKQDFDVIVLDVGTTLNHEISQDLSNMDTMILLTETNEIANRKLQKLLSDPDMLPKCNCLIVANEFHADGMRIARESIFGTIAPYDSWQEALEDPVFYRIALQVSE